MSNISRINKLVCEIKKTSSLSEAEQHRDVPINVILGSDETGKVSIMAHSAVSLALRCMGGPINVFFAGKKPAVCLLNYERGLEEFLFSEAEKYGSADRLKFHNGPPTSGPVLSLGTSVSYGIHADADGWNAFINKTAKQGTPAVAPSAVFATCCAFAKLFKSAVLCDTRGHDEQWDFSLSEYCSNSSIGKSAPSGLDLGRIGLVGAGAIGSGFAYNLWLSSWSATVDIIDSDSYEEPNIETTLLISKKEILSRGKKAKVLAKSLASCTNLDTKPIVTRIYKESKELDEYRDILICAVDNTETRQILDHANVDLIVNGAVGGTRFDSGHILWSCHGSSSSLRLSSLYSTKSPTHDASEKSGYVPIEVAGDECSRVAYNNVSLAAPFLGLSVGALLLASCAHRALGITTDKKYLKFDLLNMQSKYKS